MFLMSAVHASILRLGSGLSTNGTSAAIARLTPFTLSLSKGERAPFQKEAL
jgi:hypothetical protein